MLHHTSASWRKRHGLKGLLQNCKNPSRAFILNGEITNIDILPLIGVYGKKWIFTKSNVLMCAFIIIMNKPLLHMKYLRYIRLELILLLSLTKE